MELNEAKGAKLYLGQVLRLPADAKSEPDAKSSKDEPEVKVAKANTTKNTPEAGSNLAWYVVRPGDNLLAIARRHQIPVTDLLRYNNMDSKDNLKAGQKLRVRQEKRSSGAFHNVQKGDTLWDISRRYGVTIQQIMDWNSLSDGRVKPGSRLKVGI
jgi:membrane-bound lytic murein transglycosylase D